jgi:hypothetical protein
MLKRNYLTRVKGLDSRSKYQEPQMEVSPAALPKSGHSLLVLALIVASGATVASASPRIKVLRGANQETTYASAFPAPLVVWVTDPATERPVEGLKVNFAPGAGIELSAPYAITDEHGLASVSATGQIPCVSEVIAQLEGFPGIRATFEGLVVDKATLTVVPADLKMTVGDAVPTITEYSIKGFVNGDTEEAAHITGAPVLMTTATRMSPHANYAIKGGVGTLSSPNYTFVAGFGTLAVLNGSKNRDLPDEAVLAVPAAHEDVTTVRPAALDQSAGTTLPQPAFIAGLRGESGIFVRAAIWPNPENAAATVRLSNTRSAMPVANVPVAQKPLNAPVQAVVLPKVAAQSNMAQTLNARSALLPAVIASMPKPSAITVRTAVLPSLSTAASSAPSSYAGSAIHKAINLPAYQ